MDTQVKAEKLRECERILQAIDKCISSRDDQDEKQKAILKEIMKDVFTMVKERDALREDERILQAIDKCITSRDDQYERNKGILKEILEHVFTTMKGRDSFLREQYRGFFFVENYYKGPKVGKTEEFDVKFIIDVPLDENFLVLSEEKPGYKKLRLPNKTSIYTSQWDKYRSFLATWLINETSELRIHKNAFRRSIESLLERAMLNIPKIDNYTVVIKNGAPFTLCVSKQGCPEMNVSLVPVIKLHRCPPHPIMPNFNWYIVPEVLQNAEDEYLHWATAFYDHEDDLLARHSYIKPVIRQIEKLRDTQAWNVISCYHIKTLCMHYAMDIKDDSGVPDTCRLTGIKLFIHILHELRNACKSRDLKDCWVPTHNLIVADESQLVDIVEQLGVIIGEIIDDPAKMANWLLTTEELGMYQNELKAIGNVEDIDDPSKSLQMSEESETGSSKDILNTADKVSALVPDVTAASSRIESSPSAETGNDEANRSEEMDLLRVIAGLNETVETLSRLLKLAVARLSAATA